MRILTCNSNGFNDAVDVVVLCSNGYFMCLDVAGPVIRIGRRILDTF
jgi:hypothetical protein